MSCIVVLIDDDLEVVKTVAPMLQRAGCDVVLPSYPLDPDQVASMHFDLLMTDLFMAPIDGLEVIRVVRERQPNVGIIAFSGFAHIPKYSHVIGADLMLAKPLRAEALAQAVREVIAERAHAARP